MGRLDLRDPYRDEDFYEVGGDTRNPGTRQVRVPPATRGVLGRIDGYALGTFIVWILAFALIALNVHA